MRCEREKKKGKDGGIDTLGMKGTSGLYVGHGPGPHRTESWARGRGYCSADNCTQGTPQDPEPARKQAQVQAPRI